MDEIELLSIKDLITKGCDFLLQYARAEVGFYSQEIGVGRGATPATANAILALHATGLYSDKFLEELIEEIFLFQYPPNTKYAFSFCTEEVSSNWATAKAIYTILTVTPQKANEIRVIESIKFLSKSQNLDGGWGYRYKDPSRPYYTLFAIQALYLAWEKIPILRKEVEQSLEQAEKFLIDARLPSSFWSNGRGTKPCPVNTLSALASLQSLQPLTNKTILEYFDAHFVKQAKDFIRSQFTVPKEWVSLTWDEPGIAYKRIEPYPPGKIDMLLQLFDPFDDVVLYLLSWLKRNYISYKGTVGWLPIQAKGQNVPYSWSTARSVLSLAVYYQTVKQETTSVAPPSRIGNRIYIKEYHFKRVIYGLLILITFLYTSLIGVLYYVGLLQTFDIKTLIENAFILFLPVILLWVYSSFLLRGKTMSFLSLLQKTKRILSKYLPW